MDLDEWECLPDDGFLDFHEEKEEKRIFSSKAYSDSESVFNMNYFIIPSPNSRKLIETPPRMPPRIPPPQGFINSRLPNQLVPVPIQLNLPPSFFKAEEEEEEVLDKFPIDEKTNYKAKALEADDQDTQLSQVYIKKTWENEFANMKMESPKSPTCKSPRFMQLQTTNAAAAASIESKITSPRMKIGEENNNLFDSEDTKEEEEDGLVKSGRDHNSNHVWKLSLTGIGAICSFGFAAVTICVLFFGAHQRNNQYQQNQNRCQIYTDDNKSIKQTVEHAPKFNEAFSAVRGVPITGAHVTFGGYYNAL